jgi:peptidyl-prolyl cis-trans isomerase B (cyclophilin B)
MARSSLVLALVLALGLALAGCGGDEEAVPPQEAPTVQTEPETETGDGETGDGGATGCRDVEAPEPRAEGTETAPTALLAADKTYEVLVRTSCGDFTITLDQKASPQTAASFAALAEKGFYDGTVFHRIVPGFVIQGGDPTGTGMGGPGYTTEDAPAPDTSYTKGVVAMAKTAQDPRGTAGSQFFVVTAPEVALPADYAVVGEVTAGLDVVDRIAVLGDPSSELPTQPVVVASMEVTIR